MNLAIDLADQPSGTLHKLVDEPVEEEIVLQDRLGVLQLFLSLFEIKLAVQVREERRDRVGIVVVLLEDDLGDLLDRVPDLPTGDGDLVAVRVCSVGEDGGGDEVSGEVGTRSLERVEVRRGEENVEQSGPPVLVVEEDKETPVEQPTPGLQLDARLGLFLGQGVVDHLPELLESGQRSVPFTRQRVAQQLSPVSRHVQVERRREDEEMVQVRRCSEVVTVRVLVVSVVVERVDLFEREPVLPLEELHVPELVHRTLESVHHGRVLDHSEDGSGGFLQRGGLLDGELAEVLKVCRARNRGTVSHQFSTTACSRPHRRDPPGRPCLTPSRCLT